MVTRRQLLLGSLLLMLYASTRLLFLTKLPIFTDEAIYIRWSQIALQDPAHRFISLEDGKQPLFIWLMLPSLKFIADPLLAGRVVSVVAGLATLVGLMALGWRLFGQRIGWLTGFLYAITPFFLLYDRLALYDSLTAATMAWSLLFAVLLAQTLRLDAALLLGMAAGAGLLTKSSAQFALILLPVTLLVGKGGKKSHLARLLRWLGLAAVAAGLALLFQLLIKLSPLQHMVGLKNQTFIVSFGEFFADPFSRLPGNLRGLTEWLVSYLTVPLVALGIVGIASNRRQWRKVTLLLLWALVPLGALAVFGRVLYPRFLLFMAVPLVPLIALGAETTHRLMSIGLRKIKLPLAVRAGLVTLILIYPIYFSTQIIFNPLNAPLPLVDRNQLLDDWPSGYGITEVVEFIKQEGKRGPLFVGTEGTFGLTPAALEIYLKDEQNVKIKGYWPISDGMAELVRIANTGIPTYVLFKDTQVPRPDWPLVEAARYQKGRGSTHMILFRVLPPG